jgi:hypothetical protein
MAFNVRALQPEPADWWRNARGALRGQFGLAAVKYQTLDEVRATLQRREVAKYGESDDHKGYPQSSTQGEMLELCRAWLSALLLWTPGVIDSATPAAYAAVAARREVHAAIASYSPSAISTPSQTYETWRAVGDLARAADAARFADVKTGVTGDHPDSFTDYVGLGAHTAYEKLKGPTIEVLKGPLFDPAVDALEEGVPKILPELGIGTIIIGGLLVLGGYIAWKVIT